MEHSTISGDYKDVGTGADPILLSFPVSTSSLRARYLGECAIDSATGVITQADTSSFPRSTTVVPASNI